MSLEEDEVSPVKSIDNKQHIHMLHTHIIDMYICMYMLGVYMGFDVSGRGRDGTYGATISDTTQHKTVICSSMVYMKLSFKLQEYQPVEIIWWSLEI